MTGLSRQACPVLEVRGVSKRYGTHAALLPTSFVVDAGETVAIIGENGAGKSTLAKILTGALRPDTGTLLVDGRVVELRSPRGALEHGITLIPQELAFVPDLTAAENIQMGHWPGRFGLTSAAAVRRSALSTMNALGITIDLDARMTDLKLADRQIVEILKSLARGSRLLILDEPTASLSAVESADLFDTLHGLAATGMAVVFVSHRLDEVRRHAGRVDVFRNGSRVFDGPTAQITNGELIHLMLGQRVPPASQPAAASRVGPGLQLRGWRLAGPPPLRGVDLTVSSGEVVALFGVRGAGAEAIAETLGGRGPEVNGTLSVSGRAVGIPRTPRAARRIGIAYVPPERKADGLILHLPIDENIALPVLRTLSRWGVISSARRSLLAQRYMQDLRVRARGPRQVVGDLSGGNQQKVLLASRLAMQPRAFVLQEPTRGVDVGSRLEIHQLLRGLAAGGTSVLVVTSDIEEAVAVSDRLVVIRDGTVVAELSGADKSEAAALRAASGEDVHENTPA